MKKLIYLAILLLSLCNITKAQNGYVTIVATVKDPTGALYVNSQVGATFQDPGTSGKLPLLYGSTFQTNLTGYGTDSFAHFSLQVADNQQIGASSGATGTSWRFTILYQDRATSFTYQSPIDCIDNIPVTCNSGVMDISAPLQAAAALLPNQSGGGAFVPITVTSSATPVFNSNSNTTFTYVLNQPVTASTFITVPKPNTTNIFQFNICQNSTGNYPMVWPANVTLPSNYSFNLNPNACSPVAFVYSPALSLWTPWEGAGSSSSGGIVNVAIPPTGVCVAGSTPQQVISTGILYTCQAGTWGPVAAQSGCTTSGNQGTLLAVGTAGACQPTNVSETSQGLIVNEASLTKGPNPEVDVQLFGARAVAVNSGAPYNGPGVTGTCTSGNTTIPISGAGFNRFVNGDGIIFYGCGTTHSMSTPAAPTVTSAIAVTNTNTGYVATNSSAGSVNNRCYRIVAVNTTQGLTAASPETCISGGSAILGSDPINNTSCSRSGQTVTCLTSAHTLPVGCSNGSCGAIFISGTSDDANFGGWFPLSSVPDSTHFTYVGGLSSLNGATTSSTGGTFEYFNSDHLALPAFGAGMWQYGIYEGSSNAEVLVDLSQVNVPALASTATYLTYDYYGSTYSGNSSLPPYWPTSYPTSPTNNSLITTVVSGGGTGSLVVAVAPSNTITGTALFDSCPTVTAANNFANNNNGGGGITTFPPVPDAPASLLSYVFNSNCSLTGAISQSMPVVLNDTLQFQGKWYGELKPNPIFSVSPPSAIESHIPIYDVTAKPGIFFKGGSMRGTSIIPTGNNYVAMFYHNPSGTSIFENMNWGGLQSVDYNGVLFYDLEPIPTGAFGWSMNNVTFVAGPNQTSGSSFTPLLVVKNNFEYHLNNTPMYARGMFFGASNNGIDMSINQKQETQGLTECQYSFYFSGGNVSGWVALSNLWADTTAQPAICNFGNTVGAQFTLDGYNGSGGNMPVVSGAPLTSLVVRGIGVDTTRLGQNVSTYVNGGLRGGEQTFNTNAIIGPANSLFTNTLSPPAPTCSTATAGPPFTQTLASSTFTYAPVFFNGGYGTFSAPSNSCSANGTTQQVTLTIPAAIPGAIGYIIVNSIGARQYSTLIGLNCGIPETTTLSTLLGQNCGNSLSPVSSGGPVGMNGPDLWTNIFDLFSYQDVQETPVPANPSTGFERWYANAITHQLSCILPSGASCVNTGIGTGTQFCLTDWPTTSTLGSVCSSIAGQVPVANNGSAPLFLSPSMVDSPNSPVSTTPYLIACDTSSTIIDRTKTIRFQPGAAAITIPLSSASGCNGLVTTVFDDGAGTLTLTRSGSDTITIVNGSTNLDAQTSFTLTNGQYATLSQNATGLWLARIAIGASAGVSTITGDAGLFCNVGSAGAVTLVPCTTTLAHKFWGNNTGSTGTAGFFSIGVGDLPTGIPNANLANSSTTVNTQTCTLGSSCTITFANIPAGAIANGSTATTQSAGDTSTDIATDQFVSTAISNAIAAVNPAVAVLAATTGSNLTGTYSNGTSGIGATFTITATGAFILDGVAINTIGQRILLKDQTSAFQNGVYVATVIGATGISPVFTRALDYDQPSDINTTGAIPVQSGTVNIATSWLLTSTVNTIGTDALTYVQFTIAPSNIVTQVSNASNGQVCTYTGANKVCVPATQTVTRTIGWSYGDVATGSALTTSEVGYVTVPFACSIVGYHIMADAGTVTIKTARVNGGTALPTIGSNSISTSGVSLSTGTKVDSSTVTDFTSTTLAANDTLGFFITAVATAKQITFQIDCQHAGVN